MRVRLAALLIAAALFSSCGLLGGDTQKQLAQAETSLHAGQYATAAIVLQNLAKTKPDNAAVQLMLARVQYLRGDTAGLEAALTAATQAKADPAAIAEMRAKLALGRGQFSELLRDLDAGKYALPEQTRKLYRARAQQGLGNPVEALAIYNGLLESQPDSVDLHLYAAECHATLGRPQQALQQVEKALALQPDSASAWRLRTALSSAGDAEAAHAALQKAIDFAPGQLTVPEQLALLAPEFQRTANRLDVEAASQIQKKLLDLAPQAPLTQWTGAELSLIRGNANEADATLQHLLQHAPDFAPARPALIGALLAAGNLELAIQESAALVGNAPGQQRPRTAQQAIKLAADAGKGSEEQILRSVSAALTLEQTPAARWMLEQGVKSNLQSESLALLAIQQQLGAGQVAEALERAQALDAQTRHSNGARALLAAAEASNGDLSASQQIYEALWKQSPTRSGALALAQSRLHTHQGDPLEPLRQWLIRHPDDLLVRTGLASAAMELGQNDAAAAEYERIVAAAPTNALALNNLAWLYWKRPDARALATARRAYAAAADNPQIADTYGWLLADSGDTKTALPLLEKAAHDAPGKPEIRYHYAAVLARSDLTADRATARRWLADLLSEPSASDWRADAEKLLARLSGP